MAGNPCWVDAASIASYRCIYCNLCSWRGDDRDPGPLYPVPQAHSSRGDNNAALGKVAIDCTDEQHSGLGSGERAEQVLLR
jgi:hypothetical protein